jgi:4-alpha-glucanotransferase
MKLTHDRLIAGILEPVFAIRTEDDLGVGDTDGVRQMIDWCQRYGLHVFQTLPINETSDDNSPYNAISSLAIEPATLAVSPAQVPDLTAGDFGALTAPEVLADLRRGPVNYPKVKALKRALLQAAFERFYTHEFTRGTTRDAQFRAFRTENTHWLSDYALFRALMEANGHSPAWERWPADQRTPAAARQWLRTLPASKQDEFARRQVFFSYVQWLAFSQWESLKSYASERRVFLMGDIPFGVGRCSADTWANPDLFDLDWSGGAPPERWFRVDAFTEKWGQNWGVPNYRWDEMRRRGFAWWRTRIGNIRKVFHLCRIDHVLGFFRIYSFPWPPERNAEFLPLTEAEAAAKTGGRLPGFKPLDDDTPEHRAANQAQGEEILRVVLAAAGQRGEDAASPNCDGGVAATLIIAEDLGVVPDYVHPTLQKLGVPGFRIPAFFREPDGAYADPRKYPRLSLAQPATHDHPPLAAAWAEIWANIEAGRNAEDNRRELRRWMDFAGLTNEEPPREFTDRLHEGYVRAVMQSNSWLAVFQITDVLAQTARFNTPGSIATTNWSHRLPQTVRQLEADARLRGKTEMFARLAKESGRTD